MYRTDYQSRDNACEAMARLITDELLSFGDIDPQKRETIELFIEDTIRDNWKIVSRQPSEARWFAIDSCGDWNTFDTPDEARESAEEALEFERGDASEGWNEEVTGIMWGKVYGQCTETMRRPVTDDDCYVPDGCTEIVDYDIVDFE